MNLSKTIPIIYYYIKVDPPLESKELHFYNEKLNQFVQEYPEFKYLIDKVKAGDKEAKKIFETKSLSKQCKPQIIDFTFFPISFIRD